jgi:allantoinase
MVTDQPYRVRVAALKRMVDHPQRDKVWFTRPGEIADYVKALPAGVIPGS